MSAHGTYHGTITDTGGENCDFRGFVWDTISRGDPGNTAPGASAYEYDWTEGNSYTAEAFSHVVSALAEGDTFYVRACAHNSAGWSYGGQVEFTTQTAGSATLIAEGILSAIARPIYLIRVTLIGEGIITTTASGIFVGSSSLTGEGSLSAAGLKKLFAQTNVRGEGILFGSAYIRLIIAPAILYAIELRDASGNLVAILEHAHDISYAQMINSPHTLNFALPADDSKVGDILLANEIWLRDYKSGDVVKKFRLSRKRDTRQ